MGNDTGVTERQEGIVSQVGYQWRRIGMKKAGRRRERGKKKMAQRRKREMGNERGGEGDGRKEGRKEGRKFKGERRCVVVYGFVPVKKRIPFLKDSAPLSLHHLSRPLASLFRFYLPLPPSPPLCRPLLLLLLRLLRLLLSGAGLRTGRLRIRVSSLLFLATHAPARLEKLRRS